MIDINTLERESATETELRRAYVEDIDDEPTDAFWRRQERLCGMDTDAVGAVGEH